jgi:hypothetical protein
MAQNTISWGWWRQVNTPNYHFPLQLHPPTSLKLRVDSRSIGRKVQPSSDSLCVRISFVDGRGDARLLEKKGQCRACHAAFDNQGMSFIMSSPSLLQELPDQMLANAKPLICA